MSKKQKERIVGGGHCTSVTIRGCSQHYPDLQGSILAKCPKGYSCEETGVITGYGHPGGGPGMSSFFHTWQTDPPITAVVLSNYSGCEMVKPELDKLIEL